MLTRSTSSLVSHQQHPIVRTMTTVLFIIVLSFTLVYLPGCLSQTLLMATESGVQSLTVETGDLNSLLDLNTSVLDLQYVRDEFYFISDNLMYYSYFSRYDKWRPDPIPILNRTENQLRYLAIDWVKHTLYYSQDSSVYRGAMLGTRANDVEVLSLPGPGTIGGLAIDPYERLLFLTSGDTISSYNIDNNHLQDNYTFTDFPQPEITSIAIDLYYKELYLIIKYDQGSLTEWNLLRSNYSLEEFELEFSGPQLKDTRAMDVLRGHIVWVDDTNRVFSCNLPNCTEDNLNKIFKGTEPVYSLRYFSPLSQSPNTSVACQALYCSHSCVEVTHYSIACACPTGMTMTDNNHVCIESWFSLDLIYAGEMILKVVGESLLRWVSSHSSHLVIFVYICCGLMLALLLCGFSLVPCARKPKKSREDFETYSMS